MPELAVEIVHASSLAQDALGGTGWSRRSVQAEAASAGVVQVVELEAVGPAALVVLGGEVAGAGPGQEGVPHAGGVVLVARAPGGGGDVHDIAPAPLVPDGRDAVDHVAVPPGGVTGPDVGDAAEGLHEQRVPGVVGGEGLVEATPSFSTSSPRPPRTSRGTSPSRPPRSPLSHRWPACASKRSAASAPPSSPRPTGHTPHAPHPQSRRPTDRQTALSPALGPSPIKQHDHAQHHSRPRNHARNENAQISLDPAGADSNKTAPMPHRAGYMRPYVP